MAEVRVQARALLPTRYATFEILAFTAGEPGPTHIALTLGQFTRAGVLVRVQSECLTGEVFASLRCDCGDQLQIALSRIAQAGRGVVVYLRDHEGRGVGLVNKLRAYALQEQGLDTVDANLALGLPVDARSYEAAADLLNHLGVRGVRLMTNNPDKARAVSCGVNGAGIPAEIVAMPAAVNPHNAAYLDAKALRLGHGGIFTTTQSIAGA